MKPNEILMMINFNGSLKISIFEVLSEISMVNKISMIEIEKRMKVLSICENETIGIDLFIEIMMELIEEKINTEEVMTND